MLELRMIDQDGKVIPTLEDVTAPSIKVNLTPGAIVLADYCFDEAGNRWIKPEQLLRDEDVAAVVFGKRGQFESMVIGSKKIFNVREMPECMFKLRGSTLTKYAGQKGKEIFMFYMPPHVRKRFREPSREVQRAT